MVSDDPFAVPDVPSTGRRALSVTAFVLAAAAPWLFLTGLVGMAVGSVAHVKGDRFGMPSAVASGIGMIVGMALLFFGRQ